MIGEVWTPFNVWVERIEWQQYAAARRAGLMAEEPATQYPLRSEVVAEAKAEADRYRAISLAYAGLD